MARNPFRQAGRRTRRAVRFMDGLAIPVLIMSATGFGCAAILVVAARFFAVHEDPRIEAVAGVLPGVNCGGCGFAGCSDYAKAIVTAGAAVNLCGPGGAACAHAVAQVMGVAAVTGEKKVALILCGGDRRHAPRRFLYNGTADCVAAHAVGGGEKLCRYGCLGYGSCSRVCPVGAIQLSADHLAVVHPDLCIGCGQCVRTCPRALIKMVPLGRTIHVLCSSKDKGPVVRKACQVGCIACRLCVKLADNESIKMDGFLAVVDYTKSLTNAQTLEKCPGHCIVSRDLAQPLGAPAAPPAAAPSAPQPQGVAA